MADLRELFRGIFVRLFTSSNGRAKSEKHLWDVFVSHASEDKESIARPLSRILTQHGLRVWLDEMEMTPGDRLRHKIEHGLRNSAVGTIIVSPVYLDKFWTKYELDSLLSQETIQAKKLLVIWYGVNVELLNARAPGLTERLPINYNGDLNKVVDEILRVMKALGYKVASAQLRFVDAFAPCRISVQSWLANLTQMSTSPPSIAWPPVLHVRALQLNEIAPSVVLAENIPGRVGWHRFRNDEIRDSDLLYVAKASDVAYAQMKLGAARCLALARGLHVYGGFDISARPIFNLLFLIQRHIRGELESAMRVIQENDYKHSEYCEDIRSLVRGSNKTLASFQLSYLRRTVEKPLSYRIFAPRSAVEELMGRHGQGLMGAEIFEEFAVPQLEYRLFLNCSQENFTYDPWLSNWAVSSFKDEQGEHLA